MCGINAIISGDNIIYDLYESLYHLQHRGQDGFGISYINNSKLDVIKYKSLLSSIDINKKLQDINTYIGIGHVRYPTKGSNTINECQPFLKEGLNYNISLVHNGQIWITDKLINYFKYYNIELPNEITSDSIYLLLFISYHINKYKILNYNKIKDIIGELQDIFEGSYNCICIIQGYGLICFKDPHSIRPLILGQKDNSYIISSESVGITSIDYKIIDDIYNNELLIFNNSKLQILKIKNNQNIFKPCIFEWVYLARDESILYGVNVYQSRLKMGEHLANKIKRTVNIDDIDLVIPVPDTSKPSALQISKVLNKPYYEAITKNRYINRTFIMDSQMKRKKNIKRKLNVVKEIIYKKNILIVDDSIVRGNTIKHIIDLLKNNDVNKIFVASTSPEIINENKYGIDIPSREDLISYNKKNNILEKYLEIDKIIFLDLEDLKQSIQYFNPKITEYELSIYES
jgi:amidophosphoribosyltransferase